MTPFFAMVLQRIALGAKRDLAPEVFRLQERGVFPTGYLREDLAGILATASDIGRIASEEKARFEVMRSATRAPIDLSDLQEAVLSVDVESGRTTCLGKFTGLFDELRRLESDLEGVELRIGGDSAYNTGAGLAHALHAEGPPDEGQSMITVTAIERLDLDQHPAEMAGLVSAAAKFLGLEAYSTATVARAVRDSSPFVTVRFSQFGGALED